MSDPTLPTPATRRFLFPIVWPAALVAVCVVAALALEDRGLVNSMWHAAVIMGALGWSIWLVGFADGSALVRRLLGGGIVLALMAFYFQRLPIKTINNGDVGIVGWRWRWDEPDRELAPPATPTEVSLEWRSTPHDYPAFLGGKPWAEANDARLAAKWNARPRELWKQRIGAGWSVGEFKGYGYDYPSDKVRLDMLEEAAQVMKTMWTSDVAHFEGEHYRLDGAITRPKAMQDPHPPLWIAGGGEKRTLRIVAEHGDFANFSGDIATYRRKSEVLAGHCEAVGRDFADIGRDDADIARKLEVAGERRNCTGEEFAAEHFVATVDQAVDMLGEYQDEGCSDVLLYFYDMGRYDSRELFATEVMPQLRGR